MSVLPNVSCQLDHLVITASSCEEGVGRFQQLCGIELPVGGRHPLMGTHNHLSALSDTQFLEIIAIDPRASPPNTPRWFLLDDAEHQARLQHGLHLTTWVAATRQLDRTLERVRELGIDAGRPVTLTRDDLTWRLALRDDGSLACDGVFPVLIEWPRNVNPVARMTDQGIRLDQLRLSHPQSAKIAEALKIIGLSDAVSIEQGAASLRATLHARHVEFEINSITTTTKDLLND